MKPNLPTLTCHACGYDMHDRKQNDPCPECAAPFDTRPDAYTTPWKLTVPLVCSSIVILILPFVTLPAFVFLVPSFLLYRSQIKMDLKYRIPLWAEKRLKQNHTMMLICVAELWLILIISTFWPSALNWWQAPFIT
ncbi:MAG: hypothetical protein JKY43_00950 [Phycisphaerales bacterium]|nr:hypothetical protein [Phycisphaerales bacterium]